MESAVFGMKFFCGGQWACRARTIKRLLLTWLFIVSMAAGRSVTAAPVTLDGPVSPGGLGQIGTVTFDSTPVINGTAVFVFDLGSATTIGGGANDLYVVTGDLNLANNVVVINPTAPLVNGTYRLFNYTGTKAGALNPTVSHQTRYALSLDQATPGQINLVVTGAKADLKWAATGDSNWDLTGHNWQNLATSGTDSFFQGDTARFDDSGNYVSHIDVATTIFVSGIVVDSATDLFLGGPGKLSGLGNGLLKNGTSTLTLAGANDFLGPVSIQSGTIRLGHVTALGSINGSTTISPAATLDLGGFSPGTESITVGGGGFNGLGAIVNSGAPLIEDGLHGTVTLTADATLGGLSRWGIVGGALTGNGHKLIKTGLAEVTLSDLGNTGLGEIEIQQGTLTLAGSTLPGTPVKPLTVRPTATLAFARTAPRVIANPVVMDSAEMRNLTPGGADVTTIIGPITLLGNNSFNVTAGIRLQGEIGGAGGIIKTGSGTLALDNDNFYSGDTVVADGRLRLGADGGVGGSAHLFLTSGAVLDVSPLPSFFVRATQHLYGDGTVHGSVTSGASSHLHPGAHIGTLTITNHLSLEDLSILHFELGNATTEGSGLNDLIAVDGNLNLAGIVTVEILPVAHLDFDHPYTLIRYKGALTGDAANLVAVSDSRMTFALDTTTLGKVRVTVSGGAPELARWMGGDPDAVNAWDTKNSLNWTTAIVPDAFHAGDTALFNDDATVFSVALVGDVYPAEIRVEADAHDYVLAGEGRIRGGGLNKSLSGKLTLANVGLNDYPGSTIINGGTLQVGLGGTAGNLGPGPIINNGRLVFNRSDDLAPGNTLTGDGLLEKHGGNLLILPASFSGFEGSIIIRAGIARLAAATGVGAATAGTAVGDRATLDLNGFNLGAELVVASGAGATGRGALINDGPGQINAVRFVTLVGDTTFGGSGRWDIRNAGSGASVIGNGARLTKTGPNQVSLANLGETGLGDIDVREGVLSVEGDTQLGLVSGMVSVQPGATLQLSSSGGPLQKQFSLMGGARIFKDLGMATLHGSVSLTGSNVFDVASNGGSDFIIGAAISGNGSLHKIGTGTLILAAADSYQGATRVNQGVLAVTGSVGAGSGEVRVANGAVLTGTGTINDPTMIDVGATLAPGVEPSAIGSLTIPNNVSLAGTTIIDVARQGNTLANDRLVGVALLALGGTLEVQASGSPLQNGDTFQIFSAAQISGAFTAIHLPTLPDGLSWDDSELTSAGRLKIIAPMPNLITPVLNGNSLVLAGTGGRPGGSYRILASPDVTAPLETWTEIGNGTFNGTGSFSMSIPIDPAEPRKFYTVRTP